MEQSVYHGPIGVKGDIEMSRESASKVSGPTTTITPVGHGMASTQDAILRPIVEHIRAHGLADSSLRKLADAAGTSHRMLVYYFGSRDAVLGAVMHTLRHEESADLAAGAATRRELMERAWEYFSDPRRELEMRLFFYLAGHAVDAPADTTDFADAVVSAWTDALVRLGTSEGLTEERATVEARLLIDASRGLTLDRFLTGEQEAVHRAFRHLLDLML